MNNEPAQAVYQAADDHDLQSPASSPTDPEMGVRRFWLLWIVVNLVVFYLTWGLGWTGRWLVDRLYGSPSTSEFDLWIVFNGVFVLVTAVCFAVGQWQVLRRMLPEMPMREWLGAALAGNVINYLASIGLWFAAGTGLLYLLLDDFSSYAGNIWLSIGASQAITAILSGLVLSLPGWIVLQRYVHRAAWYVVVFTATQLALSPVQIWYLSSSVGDTQSAPISLLLDLLVLQPISIVLVGGVLAFLLGQRRDLSVPEPDLSPRAMAWSRTFVGATFAAGALLWFFYLTDYSWAGIRADIVFPPAVFVFGCVAFMVTRKLDRRKRIWGRLSTLPSILGGLGYLVMVGLVFMLPFTMGTFFVLNEVKGERLVSSVVSPDGTRVAEAYYRPAGVFTADSNAFLVRVKHRSFPILERDVLSIRTTTVSGEPNQELLSWEGNDALIVPEVGRVEVGLIKGEMPQIIALPLRAFGVLDAVQRANNLRP